MIHHLLKSYKCANLYTSAYRSLFPKKFSSQPSKISYEINTNVKNDVILFRYENAKFFRMMNFFAVTQYLFWGYLGYFAYTNIKDIPVDETRIKEDDPWYRKVNLGDAKFKRTIASFSIVIGGSSLALIWMYTLRSVRLLILNKGGKHLTFVTYTPFGQNRIMKVPISCISCKEKRTTAKVQLPIKVKNRLMHYMLDMKGEFKQAQLFDATAGLFRRL